MKYKCRICGYVYDESSEPKKWDALPPDWTCPVCGAPKDLFDADSGGAGNSGILGSHAGAPAARTASDVVAETLSNWGVKWVFGMVGHSNLGMGDAVRKLVDSGKMGYIGIRHEGAAAFACSAYGKLCGKPAACLSIAGPGATNMFTGLYDAKLDSSPVIALMGQVPTRDLGLGIFQETNLESAFSDAVVSSQTMFAKSDFSALASSACRKAVLNGGVSQIIMPDDIQTMEVSGDAAAGSPSGELFSAGGGVSQENLLRAAELVNSSKKPMIIAGAGCFDCAGAVAELAGHLKCPVATTYRAKGVLPDSFEYSCGVIGRSGTAVSQKFASEADCIIGIGIGFSRHSEIPKGGAKIVQIDIDAQRIGRLRKVDVGIAGDAAEAVPALMGMLASREADSSGEIAAEWSKWRAEKAARAEKGRDGSLSPAEIFSALSQIAPHDAIICADVGNVAYSLGRYFESAKQRFLLSWYLGSIGCGLPSAMGAWCAARQEGGKFFGRKIVAVVGDGGLGQYLSEWTTVVKNEMDIKCVVLNNSELAKISREQENAKMGVWQTSLLNPDFAEYSRLCGGMGIRIEKRSELFEKLREAFSCGGPCMVDILTDPDLQ